MSTNGRPDERKKKGVSAEIARKILELNPALREAGRDTFSLMQEAQVPSDKRASVDANRAREESALSAVVDIEIAFGTEDASIDARMAELAEAKKKNRTTSLDRLIAWLMAHDPELRSPLTQQILEEKKTFLSKIGFSTKLYLDAYKARRSR